jgi:AAA domain-containing protein
MDNRLTLLAAALGSRDACQIITLANVVKDDVGQVLLKAAGDYYRRDPEARMVERATLAGILKAQAVHEKAVEGVLHCLSELPQGVSADNVAAMVHAEHLRVARLRLAAALTAGQADVTGEIEALRQLERPLTTHVASTQLKAEDLLKACADRVPIYPSMLNGVFAGGLAPGHTGVVFGRPGAGKTLVVCNMAVGFLYKGKTVLHVMNEESQEALTMRYLSLMCLAPFGELQNLTHHKAETRDKCIRHAMRLVTERDPKELATMTNSPEPRNFQNLHIAQGIYDYGQVRELVAKLRPDLVIVDQLRHMGRGGDTPLHASLEQAMQGLRAHAHEAGFTGVGVTQAGQSGEGKPVLDLSDIDGAKTGLQGACDFIVGLGKGPDDEAQDRRIMSVCRNKVSGTITHFPVFIDKQHTRILDKTA